MTSLSFHLLNAVTLLPKASHNELCSIICFLWAAGLSGNVTHCDMHSVYGDKCFTSLANCNTCLWYVFAHGQESVVDKEQPGRPVLNFFQLSLQQFQQSIFYYSLRLLSHVK